MRSEERSPPNADAGGEASPRSPDVHEWRSEGRTITFAWLGDAPGPYGRVYALAFTPDRRMLLVGGADEDTDYWLPGGGVEPGESSLDALRRELDEEAGATVHDAAFLGSQRAEDPAFGASIQAFYWCRITLAAEFEPKHEVTKRIVVGEDEFLDRLFWGRADPKAARLLDLAREREAAAPTDPRP